MFPALILHAFIAEFRKIHYECYPKMRRYNRSTDLGIMTSRIWNKWATIRDPLDRFVSAFVNKCVDSESLLPSRSFLSAIAYYFVSVIAYGFN